MAGVSSRYESSSTARAGPGPANGARRWRRGVRYRRDATGVCSVTYGIWAAPGAIDPICARTARVHLREERSSVN